MWDKHSCVLLEDTENCHHSILIKQMIAFTHEIMYEWVCVKLFSVMISKWENVIIISKFILFQIYTDIILEFDTQNVRSK